MAVLFTYALSPAYDVDLSDTWHSFTENNNNTAQQYLTTWQTQWAITWPTVAAEQAEIDRLNSTWLPIPAWYPPVWTIPGYAYAPLLYPVIADIIAANTAGWSAAQQNLWNTIRVAVAAAYRHPPRRMLWQTA